MADKQYPTLEFVRQCLRHESGKLFWLERPLEHFRNAHGWRISNSQHAGKEAGSYNTHLNRWTVGIGGVNYFRYVIIWLLHNGEWVIGLDHKNRDSSDDRIENLRPATQAQNMCNLKLSTANTSGIKGVSWNAGRHKWQATIRVNKRSVGLGYYVNIEDARVAYEKAALKHHGEFASFG